LSLVRTRLEEGLRQNGSTSRALEKRLDSDSVYRSRLVAPGFSHSPFERHSTPAQKWRTLRRRVSRRAAIQREPTRRSRQAPAADTHNDRSCQVSRSRSSDHSAREGSMASQYRAKCRFHSRWGKPAITGNSVG